MLVICLALGACKATQLPYTHDRRACIVREARNKFAPDSSAKATTLSVCSDRELEVRARHAMCGWKCEVAQVWHVSYVHGYPAHAAQAVEFLRGRATAAWSGGATTEHGVRDENEADGQVRVEVIAQRMGITLLTCHSGVSRDSLTQVVGLRIDNSELCAVSAPGELLAYGRTAARCHDDNLIIGLKCGKGTSCCELIASKDEKSCLRSRTES
jgi:hypothetical protein